MTPSIKVLIQTLENAVYQEAMAEARDASDVTLRRKCEATTAAKKALADEFDRLQQQITELKAIDERKTATHTDRFWYR